MTRGSAAFNGLAGDVARMIVAEHPDTVDRWLDDEPGSWGRLAGLAVMEARRRLGRPLAEPERRVVWDRLWRTLEGERLDHG
ncbi:MAG: hypothetical protein GEU28_02940 [Dehalococcoidia bacterium]|nr:hypothetical protein [Dehalococcoidia bacterium]